MKILAIRGCNLTSLAGEFEVRLDHGPLADVGLFAITGPVGAGKSTLLDAMCLALYNRTPRFDHSGGVPIGRGDQPERHRLRSNDVRSVLRRGCASGRAEVEFRGIDGVDYRACWSVRRARNRIDGTIQPQSMELYERRSGQRIGDKNTEVLTEIQSRIGLSFDQFCRSTLLAQGEFARFLEAGDRERAELLERMTGTEIYGQLSVAAFNRHKSEKQLLDQLIEQHAGRSALGEEERAALEARRVSLDARVAELEAMQRAAEDAHRWYEARTRLCDQESAAEAECATLLTAQQSLDSRRAAAREQFLEGLAAVGEELRSDAERLRSEASGLEQWIRENASDEPLAAQWERWSAVLRRYSESQAEAARLSLEADAVQTEQDAAGIALDGAKASLEERARRLEVAEARFESLRSGLEQRRGDAGVDLRELDARLEAERRLLGHLQVIEQASAQVTEAREGEARAAALLAELRTAEAQAAVRLEEAERALLAAERQKSLAQHRLDLVDGEPCPLCGATEHPLGLADDVPPALRDRVAELRGEIGDLARRAAGADQDRRHHAAAAVAAEDRRKSAESQRGGDARGLGALEDSLAALQSRRGEAITRREEWDAARRDVDAADAERSAARTEWLASRDALLVEERQIEAITRRASECALRRAHEERVQAHAVEELAPAFADETVFEPGLAADPVGFAEECRTRAASFSGAVSRRAELVRDLERTERLSELLVGLLATDGERRVESALVTEEVLRHADIAELLRREARRLEQARREVQDLRTNVQTAQAVLAERRRQRVDHESSATPSMTPEQARRATAELRAELEAARGEREDSIHRVRRDDEIRAECARLAGQIEERRAACEAWAQLASLIGSSDGKAFRVYAQSLTLDSLLVGANEHLRDLAPRFRLERVPGHDLELQIVDLDMGEEVRSVKSLSGGESFLVSLALALGLSSVSAVTTRVESLFIDEGFGTLDMQTLDAALATLDALQATGRQVGIISHVAGIAERIGAQVEVLPVGSGRSGVRVAASATATAEIPPLATH